MYQTKSLFTLFLTCQGQGYSGTFSVLFALLVALSSLNATRSLASPSRNSRPRSLPRPPLRGSSRALECAGIVLMVRCDSKNSLIAFLQTFPGCLPTLAALAPWKMVIWRTALSLSLTCTASHGERLPQAWLRLALWAGNSGAGPQR